MSGIRNSAVRAPTSRETGDGWRLVVDVLDEERDAHERPPLVEVVAAQTDRNDIACLHVAELLASAKAFFTAASELSDDLPTTSMIFVMLM